MTRPIRICIVGGPRRGKSWLTRELRYMGYASFCGDPATKVKNYDPEVVYLPEGLQISGEEGAAQWVVDHWFGGYPVDKLHRVPSKLVFEGWVMARALRRWAEQRPLEQNPVDRIIVYTGDARAETSKGQEAMHKAVLTVWNQISPRYLGITEYRHWDAARGGMERSLAPADHAGIGAGIGAGGND
jgi:hypothetical protein